MKIRKEQRAESIQKKRLEPRNIIEMQIAEFSAKVKSLQESNDPDSLDSIRALKVLIQLREKLEDMDVDSSDISAEIDIITGKAVSAALTAIPKLVSAVKAKYPDEVKDELADLFASFTI